MGGTVDRSIATRAPVEQLEARLCFAVIPVNTFDDVVDSSDGLTSLREALTTSAATQGEDLILLPAGVYPLTQGQLSVANYSGAVRIHSTGGLATLDARQQSRVFRIHLDTTVEMVGLILTNGRAASSPMDSGDIGGGILNSGTLTLLQCTVAGNASGNGARSGGIGGGIYNERLLTMIDCTITGNRAGGGAGEDGGHGGGIFNNAFRSDPMILLNCRITDNVAGNGGRSGGWGGGIATSSGKLIMTDCLVTGNRAGDGMLMTGGLGGGIAETLQGDIILTRCTIRANAAGNGNGGGAGGGIFARGGTLTLEDCTVNMNVAGSGTTGGGGGGGIASTGASALLRNCRVTANTAGATSGSNTGGQGGAIRNLLGNMTLHACTLSGNAAGNGTVGGSGGAIYNSQGTIALTNCTVSGNAAGTGSVGGASGGGFFNVSSGTIHMVHCTVTANSAHRVGATGGVGGGVRSTGTLFLANTVVAGNVAESAAPDISGSVSSRGYNLVGTAEGSSGWAQTDLLNLDPLLEPLADNGGGTLTHALRRDSPAQDGGGNSRVSSDQRGEARPLDDPSVPNAEGGDGRDIGAVEMGSPVRVFSTIRVSPSKSSVVRPGPDAPRPLVTTLWAEDDPLTAEFSARAVVGTD
jgi:hypothetical protein